MCERQSLVDEEREWRPQGSLEKRLVVCSGAADSEAVKRLEKGLEAGTKGIHGDCEIEQKRKDKGDRGLLGKGKKRNRREGDC